MSWACACVLARSFRHNANRHLSYSRPMTDLLDDSFEEENKSINLNQLIQLLARSQNVNRLRRASRLPYSLYHSTYSSGDQDSPYALYIASSKPSRGHNFLSQTNNHKHRLDEEENEDEQSDENQQQEHEQEDQQEDETEQQLKQEEENESQEQEQVQQKEEQTKSVKGCLLPSSSIQKPEQQIKPTLKLRHKIFKGWPLSPARTLNRHRTSGFLSSTDAH